MVQVASRCSPKHPHERWARQTEGEKERDQRNRLEGCCHKPTSAHSVQKLEEEESNPFSPKPQGGSAGRPAPSFQPSATDFRLVVSRIGKNRFPLLWATERVVIGC